jgi:Xaa-Pro dipeptidase
LHDDPVAEFNDVGASVLKPRFEPRRMAFGGAGWFLRLLDAVGFQMRRAKTEKAAAGLGAGFSAVVSFAGSSLGSAGLARVVSVSGLSRDAHKRLGMGGGALVLFGADAAFPHGTSDPKPLKAGDVVLIDGGGRLHGYSSDITRTAVFGAPPSERQRRVWEAVRRAQTAALQAARPGAECQAVDAAARKAIEDAGFGAGYASLTHRLGHGIGMDGHEWPYLVHGNALPLAPGMTFSDEPGIYIRGEFGVRLEDDIYVTNDGAEMFTTPSPSIEHPFG